MVKRIAKTYSEKDGQIRKAVTFSIEEQLSPQSSTSYSDCRRGCDGPNKECLEECSHNKHRVEENCDGACKVCDDGCMITCLDRGYEPEYEEAPVHYYSEVTFA